MLTRCLTLAIAFASATTALATTAQEAYQKLWSKRAIDANDSSTWDKPKAACVCNDGTANSRRLGAFTIGGTIASCALPTFDAQGNVIGLFPCYIFEYIGK